MSKVIQKLPLLWRLLPASLRSVGCIQSNGCSFSSHPGCWMEKPFARWQKKDSALMPLVTQLGAFFFLSVSGKLGQIIMLSDLMRFCYVQSDLTLMSPACLLSLILPLNPLFSRWLSWSSLYWQLFLSSHLQASFKDYLLFLLWQSALITSLCRFCSPSSNTSNRSPSHLQVLAFWHFCPTHWVQLVPLAGVSAHLV